MGRVRLRNEKLSETLKWYGDEDRVCSDGSF